MRKLLSAACLVALCLCGVEVRAQTEPPSWCTGQATLSWELPTKLTDGRLIADTGGLSAVTVYVDVAQSTKLGGDATTYVVDHLCYGSHNFTVTASRFVDGVEIESAMSNVAVKMIPDRVPPEPPTLLDVIIAFVGRLLRWIGGLV